MTPGRRLLLVETEQPADLELYRAALSAEFPALDLVTARSREEAHAVAAGVDAVAGKAGCIPATAVAAMPRLEWIHALTTGVDSILAMDLRPGVVVTATRGVHGPQMSELALLQMMSLARGFPRMLENQRQSLWRRWPQPLLLGRTVVIVGVGNIGEELARRCGAFGMRVIGVSDGRSQVPGFDAIHPRSELRAAAAAADFLVVLVPYSSATHALIDASVLRAMRTDAFLVNIARGGVLDEAALIEALRERRIAGAALDVFREEPLPAASPLWSLPNVIVTPHVGGMSDRYAEQVLPQLRHNVGAWLRGGTGGLRNVVRS